MAPQEAVGANPAPMAAVKRTVLSHIDREDIPTSVCGWLYKKGGGRTQFGHTNHRRNWKR